VGRWCGSIPAMSTYRRKQQARQPGAQHRAERQARRERAAELFAQGRSRPRSPASWTSRARARAAGTLAGKPRGHGVAEPRTDGPATQDSRPCLGRDRAVAGEGAPAHGFATDGWTLERIAVVIQGLHGGEVENDPAVGAAVAGVAVPAAAHGELHLALSRQGHDLGDLGGVARADDRHRPQAVEPTVEQRPGLFIAGAVGGDQATGESIAQLPDRAGARRSDSTRDVSSIKDPPRSGGLGTRAGVRGRARPQYGRRRPEGVRRSGWLAGRRLGFRMVARSRCGTRVRG
jgi:hypothetical protein